MKLSPSAAAIGANINLALPNASGTLALTSDFAAPPAIGNTTPAAISGTTGTFSTLTANNGTLTASAPALNVQQTWNGPGVNFVAAQINVTRTASSNDAELLRLSENGTPILYFRRTGQIVGGTITLTGTGSGVVCSSPLTFGSNASNGPRFTNAGSGALDFAFFTSPSALRVHGTYTSATNFERLNLASQTGGSFIIGTEKGSAGGTARALEFQTDGVTRMTIGATGGFTVADAQDIAVGTTTGTKIGTATTQKLGFFNATPVDQPTTVTDPTGVTTDEDVEARTAINAIIDRLQELGLIA
jgi:hypothetical protein